MYGIPFGLTNGLYKSINYGESWSEINSGGAWIFSMATSYDGKYVLVAGRASRGYKVSKDGGVTWSWTGGSGELQGACVSYSGQVVNYLSFGTGTVYKGTFS
jgi:hypothetical protein